MKRFRSWCVIAFVVAVAVLAGLLRYGSAQAPSASPAPAAPQSILGTYYFQGIGLLEVRQEGDAVVTQLPSENEFFKMTASEPGGQNDGAKRQMMEKLAKYRHHGRLTAANRIEFDDMDATLKNLEKRMGLSEADLPADAMAAVKAAFPAGSLGHYYERWELLPNGSLRVECAIPIVNLTESAPDEVTKVWALWHWGQPNDPSSGGATVGISPPNTANAGILDKYKAEHPEDLTRVCGWKIGQEGEVAAWKALEAGQYAQAAQGFAAAAQAQHDWPFACLGEAWARVGTKEFDLARRALQAGRDRMSDETRPWLSGFADLLADQIASYETEAAGSQVDFMSVAAALGEKQTEAPRDNIAALSKKKAREWDANDYQQASQILTAFPCATEIQNSWQMRGRGPLLPIGQQAFTIKTQTTLPMPNFLVLQNAAKAYVLSGHLWRMQRDYAKAANQYGLVVRMGQMMRHGTLISHLIGVAMEGIGGGGMGQLFEDGLVADPQTLQTVTQMLGSLSQQEAPLDANGMFAYVNPQVPFSSDPILMSVLATMATPNFVEATTRANTVQVRLALLTGACAVKAQSLKAPFPQAMDATTLPKDPYAPEAAIRYRASGDQAVLYSVGPDQKDDGGAVDYDPTNGTVSAGDIVLTIR